MREALIEILDEHARIVEHEIPVHHGGHGGIGVQVEQVFRQVIHVDIIDFDSDILFRQYDPAAMTLGVDRR